MSDVVEMCAYCLACLEAELNGTDPREVASPPFEDVTVPLFVTLKKRERDGKGFTLRGCIGTFSPVPLHDGLRQFVHKSAFRDSRFPPVTPDELPELKCSVSLLTDFELVQDLFDWDVGVHGIWIDFVDHKGHRTTATYLPEVCPEQGWTKEECLKSLYRKGGLPRGKIPEAVVASTSLTRYQSTKASLTYAAWAERKCGAGDSSEKK